MRTGKLVMPLTFAAGVVAALAAAAPAAADTPLTCPSGGDDIAVDGMLDDWKGVDAVRIGGGDRDASLAARCVGEAGALALSFDVRDEHVVRSAVAVGPGDDLLEIDLAAGGAPAVITIAPGLGSIAPQVRLDGKPAPKWLQVETTLQKAGWSAEVVLPLAKLRGGSRSTAEVTAHVKYRDGDVLKGKTPEHVIEDTLALALDGDGGAIDASGTGLGSGEHAVAPSAKDLMDAFLKSAGLSRGEITLDARGDVDPSTRGAEHVVAGGAVIGLVGDRFTYIQLPVTGAADVIAKPRLVDLRGDGSKVVIVVVRQGDAGGRGTRDVLLGFGGKGGQLAQLFAIEVRRDRGAQRLESEWKLTGGKKPEIVVTARRATGWDADSYDEAPSGDAEPIALPWDDDRWGAAYTLDGDVLRAHKLPGKRPQK